MIPYVLLTVGTGRKLRYQVNASNEVGTEVFKKVLLCKLILKFLKILISKLITFEFRSKKLETKTYFAGAQYSREVTCMGMGMSIFSVAHVQCLTVQMLCSSVSSYQSRIFVLC